MSGLRRHFSMGLVLLMCTLTGHCSESAPSVAPPASTAASRDKQQDLRQIVEIVKHVEDSRGRIGKVEAATGARGPPVEPKDLHSFKPDREDQVVGPLYFSPKCRKLVYRLYHYTRDCTIPAFFRRCARLLTRLAGSPMCTEG
ncbi:ALK and LTK ligand 2-like [Xyrichtys novacula]|uniref:ALK and LTK ligand 2-like n=1 Tax=Xyrichtys novacula TaxID=13765 RepID=A0AAV1H159_XYRNO|nr:ALK and LTK ligand 2-like [Xyrichtys novacula]